MARISKALILAALGLVTSGVSPLAAQDFEGRPLHDAERDESLYYQPATSRPEPRSIIHQKAQARAQQRQSRLAALNWYGMSNGRPTAAPTPFTSLYSPVWQMPGGRPFAWSPAVQPTYVFYLR